MKKKDWKKLKKKDWKKIEKNWKKRKKNSILKHYVEKK